ncbi:transposase [Streptomyces sp. NPDC056352]|uniref:transposase n=1 Tax=Streptomyces sp. NPDC056352 TaxID=3345791 RepID=UPI0035D6A54F
MTDAEWAQVRSVIPVPAWLLKRGGRPEAYCHREMLDAVRYLVDNGVKWMALPVDFPYWRAVYDFFRRWRSYDYVRELHERLRRTARERSGRNAEPSAGIIDSQSAISSRIGSSADGAVSALRRASSTKHSAKQRRGDVVFWKFKSNKPIQHAAMVIAKSGSSVTIAQHTSKYRTSTMAAARSRNHPYSVWIAHVTPRW